MADLSEGEVGVQGSSVAREEAEAGLPPVAARSPMLPEAFWDGSTLYVCSETV
jgi:hypothetical protein